MVVLTISLALFGLWAQSAIGHHRQLRKQQARLQAVRLAEAGVRRAMVRRAADPQYEGETWQVPAQSLDQIHAGQVQIRVAPSAPAAVRFEATADYPAASLQRARITREVEIPNPPSGDEP